MWRPKTTALSLAFFAASLTACQNPRPAVQLVPAPPPAIDPAYLIPTPGPTRPGPDALQDAVARVLIRYEAALNKCNADKAAIAEFISQELRKLDQKD